MPRLIHYILGYVIIPNYSDHSIVSNIEMKILYAIKNGIKVNWEYLILEYMFSHSKDAIELPDAFFVSKILAYFGVNISNEDPF